MNVIEITGIAILSMVLIYYILFSEIRGLNFAVKANFISTFLAPIVSYFITTKLISDEFETSTSVLFIFAFTTIIIFTLGTLTTMKGYIDNPNCEMSNIRYYDAMKHALKLVLVCMLTFVAVLLSPILQVPFTKILSTYQTQNPQKFIYLIIGFYMAFVSLSGSVISYMPAAKDSCEKTDTDIKLEYEKGTGSRSSKNCQMSLDLDLDPVGNTKLIVLKKFLNFKKGQSITYTKDMTLKIDKEYLTTEYFAIIK